MRIATTLFVLAMVGCAGTTAARRTERPNCAWRICVEHQDLRTGRIYRAVNREPVPATVALTFRSVRNLRRPLGHIERVVPAKSTLRLAHLRAIRPGRPVGARVSVAMDLGSSTTEPDLDHLYGVPFGGSAPRRLIQAFDGPETHRGSMRYSLDFAMPEGTPVVAARAGTVLYLQDGFTRGAADPRLLERSNLVVVAHSDGTMASYGHLSAGIPVDVGDEVSEGDLLGLSGSTGFAGGPHLHFHVGVRMLGDPGRTIPFELRDGRGDAIRLEVGSLVEPAARVADRTTR